MRLVCPNCVAQYEIADGTIPESGRDVQCANCNHIWFQDAAFKLTTEDMAKDDLQNAVQSFDSEPENRIPSGVSPSAATVFRSHRASKAERPGPAADAPSRTLPEVSQDIKEILQSEAEFSSRRRSVDMTDATDVPAEPDVAEATQALASQQHLPDVTPADSAAEQEPDPEVAEPKTTAGGIPLAPENWPVDSAAGADFGGPTWADTPTTPDWLLDPDLPPEPPVESTPAPKPKAAAIPFDVDAFRKQISAHRARSEDRQEPEDAEELAETEPAPEPELAEQATPVDEHAIPVDEIAISETEEVVEAEDAFEPPAEDPDIPPASDPFTGLMTEATGDRFEDEEPELTPEELAEQELAASFADHILSTGFRPEQDADIDAEESDASGIEEVEESAAAEEIAEEVADVWDDPAEADTADESMPEDQTFSAWDAAAEEPPQEASTPDNIAEDAAPEPEVDLEDLQEEEDSAPEERPSVVTRRISVLDVASTPEAEEQTPEAPDEPHTPAAAEAPEQDDSADPDAPPQFEIRALRRKLEDLEVARSRPAGEDEPVTASETGSEPADTPAPQPGEPFVADDPASALDIAEDSSQPDRPVAVAAPSGPPVIAPARLASGRRLSVRDLNRLAELEAQAAAAPATQAAAEPEVTADSVALAPETLSSGKRLRVRGLTVARAAPTEAPRATPSPQAAPAPAPAAEPRMKSAPADDAPGQETPTAPVTAEAPTDAHAEDDQTPAFTAFRRSAPQAEPDVTPQAEPAPKPDTRPSTGHAAIRKPFAASEPAPTPETKPETPARTPETRLSDTDLALADINSALSRAMSDDAPRFSPPDTDDAAPAETEVMDTRRSRRSLVEDRKVLLPDVDALNTSLRMDSREREKHLRANAFDQDIVEKRNNFWLGLVTALVLFGIVWVLYLLGPALSETVPAVAPAVAAFRNGVEAVLGLGTGLWDQVIAWLEAF